jgi:hypothetical protein
MFTKRQAGEPDVYWVLYPSGNCCLSSVVVLYVGPDQILPLASALGAAVGVLLMVWAPRGGLGTSMWQLYVKKKADSAN